jgi:hypothetical protein
MLERAILPTEERLGVGGFPERGRLPGAARLLIARLQVCDLGGVAEAHGSVSAKKAKGARSGPFLGRRATADLIAFSQ